MVLSVAPLRWSAAAAAFRLSQKARCALVDRGRAGVCRAAARAMSWGGQDYFYGSANELSPKRQTRHFGDMHIYEMGGAKSAPSSALPIGEDSSVDPLALLPVSYTPET